MRHCLYDRTCTYMNYTQPHTRTNDRIRQRQTSHELLGIFADRGATRIMRHCLYDWTCTHIRNKSHHGWSGEGLRLEVET